jgi:two-component system nitrogen regulation sensor histidine kinase GlnL
LLDSNGLVIEANAAARQWLPLLAKHPCGSWAGLLATQPALLPAWEQAQRQQQAVVEYSVPLHTPAGTPVQVDVHYRPYATPAAAGWVLELVALGRSHELQQQSAQQQQHEAQRHFWRELAHEIRNPLGGIRAATQLLASGLQDPFQLQCTELIVREVDRLSRLMARGLMPERLPDWSRINIHAILEPARCLVQHEFPQVRWIRDYDASLPDIRGDAESLQQVVLNLLRNAAESFLPGRGGQVNLSTRIDRHVTMQGKHHPLTLRLDVTDHGAGIPADALARVFQPLFTTKPHGSGMGLVVVADRIARHGGMVHVTSVPGCTTFSVWLPVERAA